MGEVGKSFNATQQPDAVLTAGGKTISGSMCVWTFTFQMTSQYYCIILFPDSVLVRRGR